MKRRQAKKILKTWPRQRHNTLRRAVKFAVRAARDGKQLERTLDLLGPGQTINGKAFEYQPGEIALRRWIRRRWQTREIRRKPLAVLGRILGGFERATLYVSEARRWVLRTEQLYLESLREKTQTVATPNGSTIILADATGRSVTLPLSSVAVTYGS